MKDGDPRTQTFLPFRLFTDLQKSLSLEEYKKPDNFTGNLKKNRKKTTIRVFFAQDRFSWL